VHTPAGIARRGLRDLVRAEDYVLGAWMAVAGPLLAARPEQGGLFEPGRPLVGALGIVAVLGAVACLATRSSDVPAASQPGLVERGALGPLTGGLLLVAIDSATALDLPGSVAAVGVVLALVLALALHLRVRALPVVVRRTLVTPFVLAAGGIFWNVLAAVTAPGAAGGSSSAPGWLSGIDPGTAAGIVGAFAAFAGIYYAMLIYAPRQVAEREGGPLSWAARFGTFLAGTLLGLTWLSVFGT
jgi:hypothetical protein